MPEVLCSPIIKTLGLLRRPLAKYKNLEDLNGIGNITGFF